MSELEEARSKGSQVVTGVGRRNHESKPDESQGFLGVPLEASCRRSIETVSDISTYSESVAPLERQLSTGSIRSYLRSSNPRTQTWKNRSTSFWSRNKGLVLVILAQAFGALMSLTTRLLETEGSHGSSMHPFEILLIRMFVTLVFSLVYLYWAKIPHAPLGHKDVRGLLVARGTGGFFGVFGFYCSLQYLPIAEATVITFLAPTVACFACWILVHEPFTRSQRIAAMVSILGVVLIARPASLFGGSPDTPSAASGSDGSVGLTNLTMPSGGNVYNEPTTSQRFVAIGMGLVGVCGAACAYTTIRWIGKRAHPLISMTYFAAWCMTVSTISIIAVPGVSFRLPSNIEEWSYLVLLGLSGFIMQFLLTAGLAHEKSSKATNMIYTQILFALALDKLIFDTTPGGWSIVGSSLVLGSALYVAVHKEKAKKSLSTEEAGGAEELNLMAHDTFDDDDDMQSSGPQREV